MSGSDIDWREPDLKLVGLRLWVHDREFPDLDDFWDSNWLNVTAQVQSEGTRVQVRGALVRNTEIRAFADELRRLSATLKGTAELKCLEPNLYISLSAESLGHIGVDVALTPDPLNQSHKFEFGMDQTFLPPLIASCDAILSGYPVRGSA